MARQDYWTMKEIAEYMGISKEAARKKAKELGIKAATIEEKTNRYFYTDEQAEKLIKLKKPDFDISSIAPWRVGGNVVGNQELPRPIVDTVLVPTANKIEQLNQELEELRIDNKDLKTNNASLINLLTLEKQEKEDLRKNIDKLEAELEAARAANNRKWLGIWKEILRFFIGDN